MKNEIPAWFGLWFAALFLIAVTQLRQYRTFAQRQQAALRVDTQFGAGIGDVEVAHSELADAVERGERGVFDFFHAQAFRLVGQVGRFGVQNRVVVAAAQFEGDFAQAAFSIGKGGGQKQPARSIFRIVKL